VAANPRPGQVNAVGTIRINTVKLGTA